MRRFLIGSNNKTKKLEKNKAFKIVGVYSKGFTSYETTGFWQGKKEKSLVIELDDINAKETNKLAKELARALEQQTIGVQNIKTNIKFIN